MTGVQHRSRTFRSSEWQSLRRVMYQSGARLLLVVLRWDRFSGDLNDCSRTFRPKTPVHPELVTCDMYTRAVHEPLVPTALSCVPIAVVAKRLYLTV